MIFVHSFTKSIFDCFIISMEDSHSFTLFKTFILNSNLYPTDSICFKNWIENALFL